MSLDDYPSDPTVGCTFKQSAYHVWLTQVGKFVSCLANATNYSNFALDVDVTLIKGDGVILLMRCSSTAAYGYRFAFTTTYYDLVINPTLNGTPTTNTIRLFGDSGFISVNKPFVMSVVARGNQFYLYKDHVFLGIGSDSSNTSMKGQLGFGVYSPKSPTEAAFSNLKIWSLKD